MERRAIRLVADKPKTFRLRCHRLPGCGAPTGLRMTKMSEQARRAPLGPWRLRQRLHPCSTASPTHGPPGGLRFAQTRRSEQHGAAGRPEAGPFLLPGSARAAPAFQIGRAGRRGREAARQRGKRRRPCGRFHAPQRSVIASPWQRYATADRVGHSSGCTSRAWHIRFGGAPARRSPRPPCDPTTRRHATEMKRRFCPRGAPATTAPTKMFPLGRWPISAALR